MKTKEVIICGKQVALAYCYATEIAYKEVTDEDMIDFIHHVIESIQSQKDPDAKRTIIAIYSCIFAFAEANTPDGQDAVTPVTLKQMMKEMTPAEMGVALFAILDLRKQFYKVNKEDEEEIKKETSGENQKNA